VAINLNLELTDHCNIKCKMCSQSMRDEAHGMPMQFMEWSTWRAALQGLEGMEDDIHLCPHWLGEPTIHPQFDRFVEYAFAINPGNRLFREFKLHTNAVVFSEDRARLLIRLANTPGLASDTFRFVHFSIDALTPKTYAVVKGADRGEQVNRNVEVFLQARQALGAQYPYATLAFVIQPDNAHEAAAFVAHWSGVLADLGREVALSWDWPSQDRDTIYLRRLNCGDQEASDALHARIVRQLGIAPPGRGPLRSAESF
jgi:MoaA/NifB/PqqE/SkfB family radical SAM enzyme